MCRPTCRCRVPAPATANRPVSAPPGSASQRGADDLTRHRAATRTAAHVPPHPGKGGDVDRQRRGGDGEVQGVRAITLAEARSCPPNRTGMPRGRGYSPCSARSKGPRSDPALVGLPPIVSTKLTSAYYEAADACR